MAGIYDTCFVCGVALTHEPGRGKARKYCGATCQEKADAKRAGERARPVCCITGCEKPATRVRVQMCETHYYRQRRQGTTDYVGQATPGDLVHVHGYILQEAQGHPRSLGGYRAYKHRVVFYDAHGEGPFKCNWCGTGVTWDDMHVDHVDSNPANNDLENLVASCALCNQDRGRERFKRTMRSKYGITVGGVTRTINEWAVEVGISRSTIASRLKNGWTAERAVMTPRGKFGPKRRG